MSSRRHPGHLLGNGKYELVSPLGTGVNGTAWLGRQRPLDRPVVIKLFGKPTDRLWNAHARFVSEARRATLLKHPNSVRVIDFGSDEVDYWLVMELIRGRDLAAVLANERPIAARRAIAITTQILDALTESHEYGIAWRDVSPPNIMLVPTVDAEGRVFEHVKLLDFGFAPLFAGGFAGVGPAAKSEPGARPERLAIDQSAAMQAVGVLLYEMLTGVRLHAPVGAAPRPPRAINPDISERLERVVMRALAGRLRKASAFRITLLLLPEARGLPCASEPPHRTPTVPGLPRLGTPSECLYERTASAAVVAPRAESPPVLVPSRASASAVGLRRMLSPHPEMTKEEPHPAEAPRRVWPSHEVPEGKSPVAAATSAAPTATRMQFLEARLPQLPERWHVGVLIAQIGIAYAILASARESTEPDRQPALTPPAILVPAPVRVAAAEPAGQRAASDAGPAERGMLPSGAVPPSGRPASNWASSAPVAVARALDESRDRVALVDVRPPPNPAPPRIDLARAHKRIIPKRAPPKPPDPVPLGLEMPEPDPIDMEPTYPIVSIVPSHPIVSGQSIPLTTSAENRSDSAAPDAVAAPARVATTPTVSQAIPALSADVAVRDLIVRGSLSTIAVRRALDAAPAALEQCYRLAARAAQRDIEGRVDASLVVDIDGQATDVRVGSFALPGFSECARKLLARARTRERPDTGTASAHFSITITPEPAVLPTPGNGR